MAPRVSKKKAAEVDVTEIKTTEPAAEDAAPKKKTTRRTTKKVAEPTASVVIQYAGKEIAAKEVLETAKKAFCAANEGVAIESIQLYIKPEEGVAYYAVNGIGNDDYKIIL